MEIYSECLGDNLWLCSNDEMVDIIQKANPEAFWLTVDQIRFLLIINAMQDAVKCIGDIKSVYGDARIIRVISL